MKDKNPLDDDHDGRPGGRGISSEYARKYDPQGEREYTNLGFNQEQLDQTEAEDLAARRAEQYSEMQASASSRIHFWPNVGRFIIPRENSFAAHLQLVRGHGDTDLHFDPATYKLFDRIIVETANRPDLFDPAHRDYAKYATLRDNLAVLRNDIMGIYMDDGSFDPGDEKFVPQLMSIAQELGEAIGNEKKPLPRLFAPALDTRLLNMEADGAAYAYNYLEKRHKDAGGLNAVINTIRGWLGTPVRDWDLPPVEYTAFSEDGLNALPPVDVLCLTPEQLRSYMKSLQKPIEKDIVKEEQGRQDASVEENLSNAERRTATDEGITILRWFKNIKFSDKSVMDVIDTGTPEEKAEVVGVVAKFVQYYQQVQTRALKRNPNLADDENIKAANDAAKVLEHSIELLAKLEKPVSISQTQQISSDVTKQPEKWGELAGKTVDRLMQTLKGGLETAVSAFEQQQQDQEQRAEESTEQVADSLMNSDMARRKRRRQKKQASASVNAFNKRRNAGDINGDGVADSLQNLNRTRTPIVVPPQAMQGQLSQLNVQDMDLIRSLGRTLTQSGRSVPEVAAPGQDAAAAQNAARDAARDAVRGGLSGLSVSEASLNDKLKPDEQDVAKTIIDQRKREQNNPRPKGMK